MTALQHLQSLQAEGKIATIGLCNFDAIHTDEICASLGPGSIVSNQIQVCTALVSPHTAPLTSADPAPVFAYRHQAAARHGGRM